MTSTTRAAALTPAEHARTVIAAAESADLLLRRRGGTTSVPVVLGEQETGRPTISVADATGRELLLRQPVATVRVRAADSGCVRLVATFRPVRSESGASAVFAPTVLFVSLARAGRPAGICVDDFQAAQPDPLGRLGLDDLRHWARCRPEAFARLVRRDHRATVVPLGVDRFGLDLAVLAFDGVQRIRVDHPGALVADAAGLSARLGIPDGGCDCGR